MKLQDLLVEGKTLSTDSFPLLYSGISDKEREWLTNYLKIVQESLSAGEIVNPRYQDAKSYINRCLEHGYKTHISEKYFYAGKWESIPRDLYDKVAYKTPQIHNTDGLIKKTEKLKKFKHPLVTDMMAYLQEIKPLCDAMLLLKGMIVKKTKSTIDKEHKEKEFKIKLASHADVQRIREKLTQITKDVYESALEANNKWLLNVSKSVIKEMEQTPEGQRVKFSPYAYFLNHVYTLITKERGYEEGRHSYSSERYLLPNYKSVLQREAKKITDEMMRQFIEKNTNKLSEIVSRKNNLKDIQIVDANTAKGVVEGTMHLTFKDGSKFTVVNKVVLSYSKYNKAFYRFPTTFHDVTFSTGEKLKKPSEDRVLELFVK